MTLNEFKTFWESNYGDCPMIGYVLRETFLNRWFRIHSLPESRRYPENDKQWDLLLERHNQVITDIFGIDAEIILVTGSHDMNDGPIFVKEDENLFKPYNFIKTDNVDLYKLDPANYNNGQIFKPAFTKLVWNSGEYNPILAAVAEDKTRFLFISKDKNAIIAPYDGGIDFIMKDIETKDFYKEKYKAWLPQTESGL